MGDDKDAVLHRRKYHADGTHTQHVEQVSGEESKRRARDAQRARTAPTLLMRILDASKRWYNAAEEVVSLCMAHQGCIRAKIVHTRPLSHRVTLQNDYLFRWFPFPSSRDSLCFCRQHAMSWDRVTLGGAHHYSIH